MKRIGRFLAYINRARQYVGIINSSLLLIILLNTFEIFLKWYWYPILMLSAIVLFFLVGFIDTKLGVRKMEYLDVEKNQPIKMGTFNMVKKIYDDLYEDNYSI